MKKSMRKTLSVILAVMMLLGCMSITAFADGNTTDITLTVAKELTYDMVIPEAVSIDAAGVHSVGQAKVANVKNATDDTVISYTAETTDFKAEGKSDIPASYYTNEEGTTAFPTTAVEVYKSKADAASIPTMYVGISETDWNAAENGTYTATVTFNFNHAPVVMTVADILPENGCTWYDKDNPLNAVTCIWGALSFDPETGDMVNVPLESILGDNYTLSVKDESENEFIFTFIINESTGKIASVKVTDVSKGVEHNCVPLTVADILPDDFPSAAIGNEWCAQEDPIQNIYIAGDSLEYELDSYEDYATFSVPLDGLLYHNGLHKLCTSYGDFEMFVAFPTFNETGKCTSITLTFFGDYEPYSIFFPRSN